MPDEDTTAATMRTTTMRMVILTGLCRARCEAGDVTITMTFTRPVRRDVAEWWCPRCGEALQVLRITPLLDGLCEPIGTIQEHVGAGDMVASAGVLRG